MGCDIHLFVEKRLKGSNDRFQSTAFYDEFSDRSYLMFAFLADVRNYDNIKHLPLRGLPNDISYKPFDCFFKKAVKNYENNYDEECCYLQEDVDEWVKDNISFIREVSGHKFYSDPDLHSHNWCTASELSKGIDVVTNKYELSFGCLIEWRALAAYMTTLEESGVYEVRAVYCFDN